MSRPRMDKKCAMRLKAARTVLYPTAGAAARAHDWPEQTYRSHENGSRGFDLPAAKAYANAFSVRWEWLFAGDGEMVSGAGEGMAMMVTPDPAAFADAFSEAVWGVGSAGLVHANRDQVAPNTPVSGDLVVPAQHEIEVYKNSAGAVVLKMDAGRLYDEDQVVVIRPEHVDAVVAAMVRVKAEVMA